MADPKVHPDEAKGGEASKLATPEASSRVTVRMNDNVPDWSDPVCTCEAEPYWLEVSEELEQQDREKDQETPPSTP